MTPRQRRVLGLLHGSPGPLSVEELARRVFATPKGVKRTLTALGALVVYDAQTDNAQIPVNQRRAVDRALKGS
jgi:predicted transcriptional regulator